MSNVPYLPPAANAPVRTPRRRIPPRSNVFPLRTFIKTGDLVRVTGGLSAGKLCVVVRMRHDRLWIESLQGGIVCKDGDLRAVAWIERHRLCRVPDQALPQRYALPAWPARWEASLHERAEVEA